MTCALSFLIFKITLLLLIGLFSPFTLSDTSEMLHILFLWNLVFSSNLYRNHDNKQQHHENIEHFDLEQGTI